MVDKHIIDHVENLRKKLNKWCYEYFSLNAPTVSDEVYDETFRELISIETSFPELITPDSPTQRVGQKISGGLKKVKHVIPMLSLDNVFSYEELLAWAKKTGVESWVVQPKLDGLAVELVYQDGKLKHAATRGDKHEGEDVTHNIKTIKSIPLSIPDDYRVRGEVVIYKQDLSKINKEREQEGQPTYVNPRNAAAGGLRNLDPSEAKKKKLRFYAYDVIGETGSLEVDKMNYCSFIGMPSVTSYEANSSDELIKVVKQIEEHRQEYNFDIDGAVVKVNSIAHQQKLGYTSRAPRWATAIKFKAEQATTTVKGISIQVGRTGVLTPVAELDPVMVGQVMVSRATLNNQDVIREKNINIGDQVVVQRAGDVIPEIVRISQKNVPGHFVIPQTCPSCGEQVSCLRGEAAVRCVNIECPDRVLESLKHFCSRDCLNIDGLGDKIIAQLVEKGIVTSPYDLYTLMPLHFDGLERMGSKLISKIISSIQKSRKTTLDRFINSLGIPLIGKETAKDLANSFKNIDSLRNASFQDLVKLDGIGITVSSSIVNYFSKNKKLVEKLTSVIQLHNDEAEDTSDILKGHTIVVTGTHSIDREKIKEMIIQHGGKCSSSISGKTTVLLAGKDSGPKKIKKAKEDNIQIWSEDDLWDLID